MGANTISSMNIARTCDRCGTIVPAFAPQNLCLRCLFDTAVEADDGTSAPDAHTNISTGSAEHTAPPPGFGDYDLLGELGRGGQGVVYRARHRGLGRLVALKTIPPAHLANAQARERFRLEASTASRLDHPNIVPIYEVGERDGFSFYSMKLIEGVTIQQLVASGLPNADGCRHIAGVLVKVAHAVHHAHQRGVLHRDLKPSNALLDQEHEPHVADFGLARQTDEDSSLTLSHTLIGTPAYLAPEVAMGGVRQATVAADIYGLGAILYQLLTGRPPFMGATIAETLRAVQEAEPAPVSGLNPVVPADLETICLKCLEKESTTRYSTAQALADDLDRFLKEEPILAHPVTSVERAWRWCQRKPALASFVAATALLLFAVLIGGPIAAYQINRERLRAEQNLYASDMNVAHQAIQEGDFYRADRKLDSHWPAKASELGKRRSKTDLRGWEWRYLWRQAQGEQRFILGEHTNGVNALGLLKNGKTVFSAGNDKAVRFWDLESRRPIDLLPHSGSVKGGAASPDGRWLATATSTRNEKDPLCLWDLATRQLVTILTTNFWLREMSLAFSRDCKWLAFAAYMDGVRLWAMSSHSEMTNLPAYFQQSDALGLAFSPDGRILAYNEDEYGVIVLWDLVSDSVFGRLRGHESFVSALAFSPDGRTLASGSQDRTVKLWNVAEQRERISFSKHTGTVVSLAFSPDGHTLATAGDNPPIRLVDVQTGAQKVELRGHRLSITSLVFTADGRTLLSASLDGSIRVWDPTGIPEEKLAEAFAADLDRAWWSYGPALCLSTDGRQLLAAYTNQTFTLWDTLQLKESQRHRLPFTNTTAAAVANGGRLAAFASGRGDLALWEVENNQVRWFARPGTNAIRRLVFSLDGYYLALAVSGMIRVWDVRARKETIALSIDGELPMSLEFSFDHKALMAGCASGLVKFWQLRASNQPATFPGNSSQMRGLALLPDGRTLVTAAADIRFWDIETRKETDKLGPRPANFFCLALSSDGHRLAAGALDGRITIWDVDSHQEVATLRGHKERVMHLAFTPDGNHLVSASRDQLRIWRAASFAEVEAVNTPTVEGKR